MKTKCALFMLFLGVLSGCDPVSSQRQIVKNSLQEEIVLFRFPDSAGIFRDTFRILAGQEKEVFFKACICVAAQEACSKLKNFGVPDDSVRMITLSGKTFKKDWFDDNNWISEYKHKIGAAQTCTIEVFDGDFE